MRSIPNSPTRASGLLRYADEILGLQPGEYIECHACGAEFDRADATSLRTAGCEEEGALRCDECGRGGFVLRGSRRKATVAERRPMLSGQFYPSPVELRIHGAKIGLDFADRAIIEAIDQFPPGWDLTREKIAEAAGCSVARVKRTVGKLANERLIGRDVRYLGGRIRGVAYDLTPLWKRLAEAARQDTEEERECPQTVVPGVTAARIEPQTAARIEPIPLDVHAVRGFSKEKRPVNGTADCANAQGNGPPDRRKAPSPLDAFFLEDDDGDQEDHSCDWDAEWAD